MLDFSDDKQVIRFLAQTVGIAMQDLLAGRNRASAYELGKCLFVTSHWRDVNAAQALDAEPEQT